MRDISWEPIRRRINAIRDDRHSGATALTRTYCPGVITSLLVYVPLSALLVFLALREGLFTGTLLMAALAVAGILHAIEVGHNVFKRW